MVSILFSNNCFNLTWSFFSLFFSSTVSLIWDKTSLPVSFFNAVLAPYWRPAWNTFPVVATVTPGPKRDVVWKHPYTNIKQKVIKNIFNIFITEYLINTDLSIQLKIEIDQTEYYYWDYVE